MTSVVLAVAVAVAAFVLFIVAVWPWGPAYPPSPSFNGLGRSLLFPCTVTHNRIFPKKHSFTYSYLVVGVPVSWEGVAGGLVSSGPQHSLGRKKGWYHVDPDDYLQRESTPRSLRSKLDTYLESQGIINPAKYPHAYFVTAARFLNYNFNPVSFWHLYNADQTFAAIIVEANNTSDERRIYFLTPDAQPDQPAEPMAPEKMNWRNLPPGPSKIKQTWAKDFHVSPFSSRKGFYAITASDPLAVNTAGVGPINTTIVLQSSHHHGKLVGRMISTGPAVDPATLTTSQKFRFLAAWWWIGLVTAPRTLKQAAVILYRRKLHVWIRPEPLAETISRRANGPERQLESVFRQYLRHHVQNQTTGIRPLAIRYISSGIPGPAATELMMPSCTAPDGFDEIEFRVLTPAFYSRFVHYAYDDEAFSCEQHDNSTISISQPELLEKLLLAKTPPVALNVRSFSNFISFRIIQKLRERPERLERPMIWRPGSSNNGKTLTERSSSYGNPRSSMDKFVLAHQEVDKKGREMYRTYRNAVLTLFLMERAAFGMEIFFREQCLLMRVLVAWAISKAILQQYS